MDYKEKYLKYKNKYLNLQNYIKNLKGGVIPNDNTKLIDCYIASSHNTYLDGHQMTGTTDKKCYSNFIKHYKGGCVEMDVVNLEEREIKDNDGKKKNFDVKITHTGTGTSSLWLRDILQEMKNILTDKSISLTGPIILSFDNKDILSDLNQRIVIDIIKEYLDHHLYKNYDDENLYIKDIKGKVLIKWPERHTEGECTCTKFCFGKSIISKIAKKKLSIDSSLHDCKNLIYPEGFENAKHWTNMHQFNTISYSHGHAPENMDHTKFIRMYPPGGNTASENYPFLKYILKGAHLVALNIQTLDIHTLFQLEFFRKGCLHIIPASVKENKLNKKKYTIHLNEKFNNIKIYIDDNDNKSDLSGNKNVVELYEDFPLIYIECTSNNKKYKGAITLTEKENKLYQIDELYDSCTILSNKCNCNWYNTISNNILNISCKEKDNIYNID